MPVLIELHDFIEAERERLEIRHNNLFGYSFAAIGRYHAFLETVVERHNVASRAMMENTRAILESTSRETGTRPLTPEEVKLHEEAVPLSLAVQLEQESFYLFAKILLDKVAHAVGFYFGTARGCSTNSHDDLTKSIRRYAELKGLTLSDELVAEMERLKSDIADFRDKQITHEKSPRTMRPMLFDDAGNVRMALHRIYPVEGDAQVESRNVHELMAEVEDYIRHIVEFVKANRDRTALSLDTSRLPETSAKP